jgi:toxin ParE1/3/4
VSHYRLSQLARSDIIEILVWSKERFGAAAHDRYRALLVTAIGDIASDPTRVGSKSRPELGDGVRSWHIRHSRDRSPAEPVHTPRHFLVYKSESGLVVIGRVLHDAMDLSAHVDSDAAWR